MKALLIVFVILAVVGGGVYFFMLPKEKKSDTPKVVRNFKDCLEAENLVIDSVPRECHTKTDKVYIEIDNSKEYVGIIQPTGPAAYTQIESPFKVEGVAVGGWFYNNQLVGKLVDEKETVLATFYPKTSVNTDTTELIPFVAAVHFHNPATKLGKIVIEKANLGYHEGKPGPLVIPVEFK